MLVLEPNEQFLVLFATLAWGAMLLLFCSGSKKKVTDEEIRWNIATSGPISMTGLENIANHKYKSGGWTKVDLILDRWWSFVGARVPDSIAPNVVTLFGFAAILVSTLTIFYYQPSPYSERPNWIGFLTAVSMFFYQTFDAVDGKHARRSGQSSPLGQLFDHGIDGLTLTFATYNVASGHGFSPLQFYILMTAAQITYYCAQWSERHTHVLATNFGLLGVTEVQIITALLGTTTYFVPFHIWSTPLSQLLPDAFAWVSQTLSFILGSSSANSITQSIFSLDLHWIIVAGIVLSNVWILYCQLKQVFDYYWGLETREDAWKGFKQAFLDLIPIIALVTIHYAWIGSPTSLNYPICYILTLAFLSSHLTNQIIISGMARDHFSWWQPSLLPFLGVVGVDRMYGQYLSSVTLCILAVSLSLFSLYVHLHWATRACMQIAARINIYVLKPGHPYTSSWETRTK